MACSGLVTQAQRVLPDGHGARGTGIASTYAKATADKTATLPPGSLYMVSPPTHLKLMIVHTLPATNRKTYDPTLARRTAEKTALRSLLAHRRANTHRSMTRETTKHGTSKNVAAAGIIQTKCCSYGTSHAACKVTEASILAGVLMPKAVPPDVPTNSTISMKIHARGTPSKVVHKLATATSFNALRIVRPIAFRTSNASMTT